MDFIRKFAKSLLFGIAAFVLGAGIMLAAPVIFLFCLVKKPFDISTLDSFGDKIKEALDKLDPDADEDWYREHKKIYKD